MKIRIYDVENLPFGTQVSVVLPNGNIEKGISLTGSIGCCFKNGMTISFKDLERMEVYLGWDYNKYTIPILKVK